MNDTDSKILIPEGLKKCLKTYVLATISILVRNTEMCNITNIYQHVRSNEMIAIDTDADSMQGEGG